MEQNYEDYQSLIFKLANNHSYKSGLEVEDLISAGNEEFLKTQKLYNPNHPKQAKFSTYLAIRIIGLFREMSRKRNNEPIMIEISNESTYDSAERQLFFKEILEELSSDAKEVIKIVLDTPMDLLNMITNRL